MTKHFSPKYSVERDCPQVALVDSGGAEGYVIGACAVV